ncbi:MAG: hypothetical protein LBN23_06470 [Paludibacter sp.]|jgi:hypothetical protein|nr:hypothetical protein [Paludibacter sp.]
MKPTILILGIYFLFLAVMPCHCEETPSVIGDNMVEMVMAAEVATDNHFADNCTPFCACAGNCHSANLFAKPLSAFSFVNTSITVISFYKMGYCSAILPDFTKPPKAFTI